VGNTKGKGPLEEESRNVFGEWQTHALHRNNTQRLYWGTALVGVVGCMGREDGPRDVDVQEVEGRHVG